MIDAESEKVEETKPEVEEAEVGEKRKLEDESGPPKKKGKKRRRRGRRNFAPIPLPPVDPQGFVQGLLYARIKHQKGTIEMNTLLQNLQQEYDINRQAIGKWGTFLKNCPFVKIDGLNVSFKKGSRPPKAGFHGGPPIGMPMGMPGMMPHGPMMRPPFGYPPPPMMHPMMGAPHPMMGMPMGRGRGRFFPPHMMQQNFDPNKGFLPRKNPDKKLQELIVKCLQSGEDYDMNKLLQGVQKKHNISKNNYGSKWGKYLKQLEYLEFDGNKVSLKEDYSEENYPYKAPVIYTRDQVNLNAKHLGRNPRKRLKELIKEQLEAAEEPIALNQLLQTLRQSHIVDRHAYGGKWSEFLKRLVFAKVEESMVSLVAQEPKEEEVAEEV